MFEIFKKKRTERKEEEREIEERIKEKDTIELRKLLFEFEPKALTPGEEIYEWVWSILYDSPYSVASSGEIETYY